MTAVLVLMGVWGLVGTLATVFLTLRSREVGFSTMAHWVIIAIGSTSIFFWWMFWYARPTYIF